MNEIMEKRKAAARSAGEIRIYLMTLHRLQRTGTSEKSEPLGQMTLASYLRMLGWDAVVFNGSLKDGLNLLTQSREEDKNRTVIVGLYSDYDNLNAVVSMSRKVKEQTGYITCVGGPQANALDESFLRNNPAVDFFIRGDGEYALSDALEAIHNNDRDALSRIPGVGTLNRGVYRENGVADPIMNLDEAPILDSRCLINQFSRSVLVALSGRGCPFHCAFCFEGGNSKTVRLRSVEHMLSELKARLESHPEARYIYFGDDTFTLQPERLKAFCDGLKELRKEHYFVWFCDGHVNVLLKHPEYIRMMVDAGLVRLQIGIESTCQEIIDLYNKNIRKEDLYSVVDLCLKEGLPQLAGNIIIGGAKETMETVHETFETIYDLLRRSRGMLDVTSTLYSHFPGTAIYRDPETYGIRVIDTENLRSFGDYPVAETTGLDMDTIASLRREFIVQSNRVMQKCVDDGLVDEKRMIYSSWLSEKYGITNLWTSLGLRDDQRRYYTYAALYGVPGMNLTDIPVRTVFFHGETRFPEEIARVDGYPLSPFEDELYTLLAGKLTLNQVIDRLEDKWLGVHGSRAKLEEFTMERLEALRKRRLAIMTTLDLGDRDKLFDPSVYWAENPAPSEPVRQPDSSDGKEPNKVLLFYPYTVASSLGIKQNRHTLGVFILSAVLNKAGYEAKACECAFPEIMEHVRKESDGLLAVGLSLDYENRRLVLGIAEKITRELGIPVLIGGVDARTITEEELRDSKALAVLKGEGEITLPKVISCLKQGGDLKKISGLKIMDGDHMVDTGAEEPPENLDQIPFPAYETSMVTHDNSRFTVMTSRGCPNHCVFCHEGLQKTPLRFRSIGNVLSEIEQLLVTWPKLQFIVFADDTLVLRPDRVKELCEGLKALQEKYHPFSWYCEGDVRSLDKHPELLPMMIDAGMKRLQIGIESGDSEMLKIYEKPSNNDAVRRVVKNAFDSGLHSLIGPILVGAPFENPEHIKTEKTWIRELYTLAPGVIEMPISIISPYSQTPIGQDPARFGYTFTDACGDRSNTDYPAYHTEKMTEKEILGAYQELSYHSVQVIRDLIDGGKVPVESLLNCMKTQQTYGSDSLWLRVINAWYPILFSYLQLKAKSGVPDLAEIDPGQLPEWHLQRTLEIWRFVSFTDYGPRIGKFYLSPYEYDVLLCCAGKLSIREIAQRLQPVYNAEGSVEEMEQRIEQTAREFESRYWVVPVEF